MKHNGASTIRLTAEDELLIACVRTQLNTDVPDGRALESRLSPELDWSYFLQIASANRVIPFAWHSLSPLESRVPKPVAQALRSACAKITAHHIVHLQELRRLSGLLQQHGIAFIPLKGPCLGSLYRRPAMREWGDLDILIRRSDVERFDRLLPALDYKHGRQENGESLQSLLAINHAYNIIKTDGSVCIDVHWQLADGADASKFPAHAIWTSCREEDFYDFRVLKPDYEKQLLYTCLHHGLRQGWSELRMVADWVILLRTASPDTDWAALLSTAGELGFRRAFLTGTALARWLGDFAVPEYLSQRIKADKAVHKASMHITKGMFKAGRESPRLVFYPHNRLYVEDHRMQARWLMLKKCLRPNLADKALIPLPAGLHFMYYMIRPIRLIRKYGGALLSKSH